MSPRKRQPNQEWLNHYPGLYVTKFGVFYVRHPITRKQASLETKDKAIAIKRWSLINKVWEAEKNDFLTDRLAARLQNATDGNPQHSYRYLCDYLTHWRKDVLGHHIDDGKMSWTKCYVISTRGKNRGQEISTPSKIDYASDCQQLERSEAAKVALTDKHLTRRIRQLLSPWTQKPTHYNGLRNTLSRILDHAIAEGVLDVNPMRDIKKIQEPKREVYIPDDAYVKITEHLYTHELNKRTFNGEWRAKICDMIYMMSQQPIDVFGLKEEQIHEGGEFGELHLTRHKTNNGIIIEMNEEMAELVAWFRNFKKEQQIVSPFLMVYPRYFDMRSRGKPVKHRYLQGQWAEAVEAAGFKGQYQLRDLRKKGLTEEFLSQGDNDKGGHDTEAMKAHYRLVKPPKRARNTLKSLRTS